ncbi:hypothetical protein BSKO_08027 [Bryopsis sp. KO-2023]|nr:hypothetical protein BSKO_08027 [Bryopsis sp. KO-2023]
MADVVRYELRKCKDRGELESLYARFAGYLDRTPFIDPPTHNTLVVCAEVAIEVGHLAAAQDALDRYFEGADGIRDQYLCRALFARALLHHYQTKHLKGKDLVSNTIEGISYILEALKVAAGNDRYAFLVYNGSVHFWHISRPLQRECLRKHLLESQQAVVEALEQVPAPEAWKVRNKINLALCFAEANQLENASKALDSVAPLEEKIDMSLKRLLYRCRVHIGCVTGKVKGAVKFEQSELTATGNIQLVKSSALPLEEVEKLLTAAWEEVDPAPDGPTKDVPLNVVAAIGWAAALKGITTLAKKCATRSSASQDVAPRAWAALIEAQLAILDLGDHKESLTKRAVDARIVTLATCERAMSDFLRIEDVHGVQESCRLMWNAGLPLLQDNLRHHIKKSFASACRALATIDSPLHKLRIQFHLEVSKCDANDELVLKARDEVRKACALDYVANPEDAEKHGYERPLDRHLEPFERGLTLRTSGADECRCVEDEVLLLIERAKESSSPHVKEDCLKRAMDALELLPLTECNEDGGTDCLLADKLLCRKRCLLWGSLIKCAWSVHLQEIVRAAAPYALRPPWNPETDYEMALLQVEVGFLEAEACVVALKSSGAEVVPSQSEVEMNYSEKGMRLSATNTEELKANVLMSVLQAMKTAEAAKEIAMVSNGGACAWNYYKPLIKQWRFAELGNAMSDVLEILMQVEVGGIDPMLLCDLAETHLKSLEHRYLLGAVGQPEKTEGGRKESIPDLLSVRAAAGKLESLEKGDTALIDSAVDLCKRFAEKYSETLSQELIETISRIESLKANGTAKEGIASSTSKTGQFVAILSSLASPSTQRTTSEDLGEIKKAIQILRDQDITDSEMWSKLGRACVRACHFGEALDCAEVALKALPDEITPESILYKSDCGRISDKEWHWLAVAELVMGQAMVGLLEAGSQEKPVEIDVKKTAMGHFVVATRFSSFVHAIDLMDNLAVCAWNIAKDFVSVPGLICTLSEPLTDLTELLNASPIPNGRVQVGLSCLVLQLHLTQGSYQEGLHHAHAAIQATPKSAQRPLIPYKIQLLKVLGTGVKEEMAQVMEYQLENQSFAWSTFADLFAAPTDQLEARRKSLELSMPSPYINAHCRLDYAEWLHTVARESDEAVSIALSTGEKSVNDLSNLSLVQKCDILCRCHLLLYRIAQDERTGFEHLMAAYEACLKILTSTLTNACAGENDVETEEEAADVEVPCSLTEWITFTLSDIATNRISSSTNHTSVLNVQSKILAERFESLLDVLAKELQAGGCQMQCIPILHLHLILAKCVIKCEMLFTMVTLRLASTLKGLGLSDHADSFEKRAGKYWEIDEPMLDSLHDYMESRKAAASWSTQITRDGRNDPSAVLHRMRSYEFLLFVGGHLLATDRPGLAEPILVVVLEAARAHDDRASQACCLAHLADCGLMLGNPEKALANVTAALEYDGGDVEFWELATYVFVEAAQTSKATMECVEKTIKTALHVLHDARSKDERCRHLDRLEAFLQKSMGDIKIMEFVHDGMPEMHQCAMGHYRTSFELLKRSGQMEIVDAAEALCHAITVTPTTEIDGRPLLRDQKAAWEGAEAVLSTISARADPGGAFDGLTSPSSRKLVQVRMKLAGVHLELAKECQKHRDRDAASRRPDFQKVPGKDTAVIERYLDSILGMAVDSVAVHMETSLLFSGKAANGTALPLLRAPALALTGDAMVFEAYRSCPDSDNPWSVVEVEDENSDVKDNEESSGDAVEGNEEKTGADVEFMDPTKKAAIEKTKKCISQASHLYQESLELIAGRDIRQCQQSAFSSILCFGRWNPRRTAEHLCLSQSYRMASILKLHRPNQITTPRPDPFRNRDLGGTMCNDLLKSHSLKIMDVNGEVPFAAGIEKLNEGVNLLVMHMDPGREHVYVALIERCRFISGAESGKAEGVRVERFLIGGGGRSLAEVSNAIERFGTELKSGSSDGKLEGSAGRHAQLEECWKLCLEAAEDFFSPVMDLFEAAATPPEGGPPPAVILLVDPEMDAFPFESFGAFKNCASVSRDFSLALLMSRMETEVDAAMSDFKFIAEPKWCPTNGGENADLSDSFKKSIVDQFGKLEGLSGSQDCSTSVEEAQELLAEAKSFLYHGGPSFLGGFMSPLAISSLDLSQCKMAVLLHRETYGHSHELMDRAFSRSQLSTWSHNLPFCSAALLSACGAKSIAVNGIPLHDAEGIERLQDILQGVSTGVSIGQAVRSCFKEDRPAFERSQLRVYGIPTLTAGAAGKGGKNKKKK